MSYQDDPNVKRKLEDLEAELHNTRPLINSDKFSEPIKKGYQQFMEWFKELPKVGQIAVAVVGIAAALTLLRTLVELISLAITLAVIGIIVYIGYQLFKSSKFFND
jgi:phage shock protein PspC (stress-responsive transcriptional regulator)